jgi:two-component system NtrC family sensor kinase
MSILIVDDEEEYLHYLDVVLSQDGRTPQRASTGRAARKIIEGGGLSVVLMDLHLPDASGLDLMSLARSVDPMTVVIAMTAFGSHESAMEALRLGAYDYLLKPTDVDAVKAAVRRALEHHELRKTLIERTHQLGKFQAESRQANELMGLVSHKLRNPLSVVCGYASFFADNDPTEIDQEEWRKGIEKIRENAVEMRAVLDGLLPEVPQETKAS